MAVSIRCIFDIFDKNLYYDMLEQKYVRAKLRPDIKLGIIEYTEKAVHDNLWNEVTRNCRGLIVDYEGNVIARPFAKFMNYDPETDGHLLDEEAVVLDKIDGSLGILYIYDGKVNIATKGPFFSDQALHATQLLRDKYPEFVPAIGWTYLFEIVYPENRIVVDYERLDDLILLGARHIDSGQEKLPNELPEWSGPITTTFPYKSLREALQALPRPNAEGFVVYFPRTGERIKVKYEDYLALHKLIFNLSPRKVWESMKAGKSLEEILAPLPDEWHAWTRGVFVEVGAEYCDLRSRIETAFLDIELLSALDMSSPSASVHRKKFAELARATEYPGFMFSLLDHKDISQKVWDMVRPHAA